MAKTKSKTARWQEAVAEAIAARDKIQEAADELAGALSNLRDVQSEYQDWRDNLPENLAGSALGEKLDQVCELDLDNDTPLDDWGTVSDTLDEAEGMDLPLGFGRD